MFLIYVFLHNNPLKFEISSDNKRKFGKQDCALKKIKRRVLLQNRTLPQTLAASRPLLPCPCSFFSAATTSPDPPTPSLPQSAPRWRLAGAPSRPLPPPPPLPPTRIGNDSSSSRFNLQFNRSKSVGGHRAREEHRFRRGRVDGQERSRRG